MRRVLPQDIDAESAVLSAMMLDEQSCSRALEFVEEKHFYKSTHRFIFRAIATLYEDGIEVDIITLIDRLKKLDLLEKSGGNVK